MSISLLLDRIKALGAPLALDIGNAVLKTKNEDGAKSFERIKCIIDATASKTAAYYLETSAFKNTPAEHSFLTEVLSYAKDKGAYIILDFKALTYSEEINKCLEKERICDAVTACPYLGEEYIQPFVFAANKFSKSVFLYLNTLDDFGFTSYSDIILRLSGQAFGTSKYSNIGVFLQSPGAEGAAKVREKLGNCMILTRVSKINSDIIDYFDDDGTGALPIISLLRQDKDLDFDNLYVEARREAERNIRALNKTLFRKSSIIQI